MYIRCSRINSEGNLLQRLTRRLNELGVDMANLDFHQPAEPDRLMLTADQQQELDSTLASITDLDAKFDACVDKLTEFGCTMHDT